MSQRATWEDLDALAEGERGEIVGGELVMLPRPSGEHGETSTLIVGSLLPGFWFGRGGPGGWVIVHEPGVALFVDEIRIPDVAGWKRERYARPDKGPYVIVPDWVCEVLSPSNEKNDRAEKLPLYARSGVRHVWIVDPLEFTLEVYRLEGEVYVLAKIVAEDAVTRLEPFDAVEFEVGLLWGDRLPKKGLLEAMTNEKRLDRVRALVAEIGQELDAMGGIGAEELAERQAEARGRAFYREALETLVQPLPGESICLDFGKAPDTAIAQFMLLDTPVSIPSDFEGARALFESLAAEAEYVGRRGNGGHCWRIRVVDNGEFQLWTTRDGRIEVVEYGAGFCF